MALIGTEGGAWPPVEQRMERGVKTYSVTINGNETELLLSDEDAKARGLKASDEVKEKARTPANKARTPANKAPAAPARKTPAQKRAETVDNAWQSKKGR